MHNPITVRPIPTHPRSAPAVASPSPDCAPPEAAISRLAIGPVITATMLPTKGNSERPRIPATRLTTAMVLVEAPAGADAEPEGGGVWMGIVGLLGVDRRQ